MVSEISHDPNTGTTADDEYYEKPSGWGGWITFAAAMMIIVGMLNAMNRLVAILNDDWVVWTNRGDLYFDLSTWGWIHLAVGIAVVLAGFGLITGNVLARTIAVLVAGSASSPTSSTCRPTRCGR